MVVDKNVPGDAGTSFVELSVSMSNGVMQAIAPISEYN
jgi:hypothetical protein